MAENQPLPPSSKFHPSPSRPKFDVPAGAWDTAFHIIDPPRPGEPIDPHYPAAPTEAARMMHGALGVERGVLVQAGSEQAADYDQLLRQLKENPHLKGMAVMRFDASDADLERLDQGGVRGIRFHFAAFLNRRPTMDFFHRSVERVKPLGWSLSVHIDAGQLDELAPILRAIPMPVLVNHIARVEVSGGPDQPVLKALLELQRSSGNIWIQIANLDRSSKIGEPTFADAVPLIRAAVKGGAPERMVWGTDWPHIGYKNRAEPNFPAPDDGNLLNLLYDGVGDERLIKAILVDNPARLYDGRW